MKTERCERFRKTGKEDTNWKLCETGLVRQVLFCTFPTRTEAEAEIPVVPWSNFVTLNNFI